MNVKFPKDALCQSWLKYAHWFWRRTSEKFTTTKQRNGEMSYEVDKSRNHQTFCDTFRNEAS